MPPLKNTTGSCYLPDTCNKKYNRTHKTLKINPRQLKMEKWVSSKNVNLIAKIQYKVHFSSKTKWREDHVKIIFTLSGWFYNPIGESNIEKESEKNPVVATWWLIWAYFGLFQFLFWLISALMQSLFRLISGLFRLIWDKQINYLLK